MKRINYSVLLIFTTFISGCVTDEIGVKTTLDPQASHSKESLIYVDAQSDIEIENRKYFLEVPEIIKELGFKVVPAKDADYVLFVDYNANFSYKAGWDEVRYHYLKEEYTGLLDLALYRLQENKENFINKTEWEGFVNVGDIREREELRKALKIIMERFTKEGSENVGLTSN
jgi:hypothetical protein